MVEDDDAEEAVNIETGLREKELVDEGVVVVEGATQQLEKGLNAVAAAEDQVLVNCRQTVCHIEVR